MIKTRILLPVVACVLIVTTLFASAVAAQSAALPVIGETLTVAHSLSL